MADSGLLVLCILTMFTLGVTHYHYKTIHICRTRQHHCKNPTTIYSGIDNYKIWDTDVPKSTPLFLDMQLITFQETLPIH